MKSVLMAAAAAAALGACAPATQVILLPQADRVTALQVSTGRDSRKLSGAYAEAGVSSGGSINVGETNAARVQSRYAALLALPARSAQPLAIRFERGSGMLTPQSRKDLDGTVREAQGRADAAVEITLPAPGTAPDPGAGTSPGARAQAVRTYLIAHGVAPERIRITESTAPNGPAPAALRGAPDITVQVR